jgi:hypothetical protein
LFFFGRISAVSVLALFRDVRKLRETGDDLCNTGIAAPTLRISSSAYTNPLPERNDTDRRNCQRTGKELSEFLPGSPERIVRSQSCLKKKKALLLVRVRLSLLQSQSVFREKSG